jgi:hypothetical protein
MQKSLNITSHEFRYNYGEIIFNCGANFCGFCGSLTQRKLNNGKTTGNN